MKSILKILFNNFKLNRFLYEIGVYVLIMLALIYNWSFILIFFNLTLILGLFIFNHSNHETKTKIKQTYNSFSIIERIIYDLMDIPIIILAIYYRHWTFLTIYLISIIGYQVVLNLKGVKHE